MIFMIELELPLKLSGKMDKNNNNLFTRSDYRIPYIAAFNIITLTIYGGLASPLNLVWMETFKPFSGVILVNRSRRQDKTNNDNDKYIIKTNQDQVVVIIYFLILK